MKYHILQISLTDAEVDLINEKGHDAVARHARHLDVTIRDKSDDLLHTMTKTILQTLKMIICQNSKLVEYW